MEGKIEKSLCYLTLPFDMGIYVAYAKVYRLTRGEGKILRDTRSQVKRPQNSQLSAAKRKSKKSRRKLVLDDRARGFRSQPAGSSRRKARAVLSLADRRLTLRPATPRIHTLPPPSISLPPHFPLPPLCSSLVFFALSSRRKHANSRDARNIKPWRSIWQKRIARVACTLPQWSISSLWELRDFVPIFHNALTS